MGSERNRYVAGFVFAPTLDRVLLLRKTRPAWQAGKLNGFGGKVEPGESFEAAMHRESIEEAGMTFEWEHFATLLCNDDRHSREIAFFRAVSDDWYRPGRNLANDVGELFVTTGVGEIVDGSEPAIPNLRWLVPMALAENDRHDWPYLVSERAAPTPGAEGGDDGR